MFFSFYWDLWRRSFALIGTGQELLSSEYTYKSVARTVRGHANFYKYSFDDTSLFLCFFLEWRNIEHFALDINVHLWPLPTLDQNLTETCA